MTQTAACTLQQYTMIPHRLRGKGQPLFQRKLTRILQAIGVQIMQEKTLYKIMLILEMVIKKYVERYRSFSQSQRRSPFHKAFRGADHTEIPESAPL